MSVPVTSQLDPYLHWFNIQSPERPLSAYQLLGLRDLEVDRKLIRAAGQRRQYELELHRSSADPALWEQLADEVQQAVQLLDDSRRKSILDASLRRRANAAKLESQSRRRIEAAEQLSCPGCGVDNAGGRRFCAQCGLALWTTCTNCGTECPSSEAFCGDCGCNLKEAEQRFTGQFQRQLDEAAQLRSQGRYDDALGVVCKLATQEDPRLEAIIQRATHLFEFWQQEVVTLRRSAAAFAKQAEEQIGRLDFSAAIELLQQVPPAFRDKHFQNLLATAQHRRDELTSLETSIQEAVSSKQLRNLGAKIDRLLELRPGHGQATRLAMKLGKSLISTARSRVQAAQYHEAAGLLDEVPQIARDETHARLLEQVQEMCWLVDDVQYATQLDATTLGAAQRLVQTNPQDTQATAWLEALRSASQSGHSATTWKATPTKGPLGLDVASWDEFAGLDTRTVAQQKDFRLHAGEFAVACGLALQGLGHGPMSVNLNDSKRHSRLGGLSLKLRRSEPQQAWGLDLGTVAIKAVKLTIGEAGRPVVSDCFHYELPGGKPRGEREPDPAGNLAVVLRQLVAQHRMIDAERICVSFPTLLTLTRMLRLPPASDKQVRDALLFEAKHQFPIALEELVWDYQLAQSEGEREGELLQQVHALLVAAKRVVVSQRLEEYNAAGLRVDVLQCTPLALANLLSYQQQLRGDPQPRRGTLPAVALLDMGASNSSLTVVGDKLLWCRSLPITGDSFSDPLIRNFQLTTAQAELLKREPLRAKRLGKLYAQLEPVIADLLRQLHRSFEMFQKEHSNYRIQKLLLTGGAARLHGLVRYLRHGT